LNHWWFNRWITSQGQCAESWLVRPAEVTIPLAVVTFHPQESAVKNLLGLRCMKLHLTIWMSFQLLAIANTKDW